jgi:hypothetical protein
MNVIIKLIVKIGENLFKYPIMFVGRIKWGVTKFTIENLFFFFQFWG